MKESEFLQIFYGVPQDNSFGFCNVNHLHGQKTVASGVLYISSSVVPIYWDGVPQGSSSTSHGLNLINDRASDPAIPNLYINHLRQPIILIGIRLF